IMYPTAAASVSGSLLSESMFSNNELLQFGGEEQGEQLMQILQSQVIRDRIVQKYNLVKHYKIDPTSRYFRTRLNKEYDSNIKIRRTELMSIVVDVLDTDPDTAAFIANDISNLVDTVINQITRERAQKALTLVGKERDDLTMRINLLQDSLKQIQEQGIVNYESQSAALSNAYAQAVKDGNQRAVSQLEKKINILAKYGGTFVTLQGLLQKETERLSQLSAKYQQARADAEQDLPYKYVIDKASSSDKKASPKRSIIVLASTFSAFFLALLLLLIVDTIRKHND
ncbi:MAG TPA: hypothetical protein VHO72_16390, partial [Bacteroidales bacterium]|nr:hypothetical protein [Bacteroidales bacterium]